MLSLTFADRPPSAATRSPLWAPTWNRMITVVAAAVMAFAGWQNRWISDDGLIAVRTVEQLLAGNGPVFNIGERVEANTSTAWTYLITVVSWLTRGDVAYVSVLLGLMCTVGAVTFAMLGAMHLHGGSRWFLPAGVLVVLALPPFWEFATSGLETGLAFLWIGLSWWLLVRAASDGPVLPLVFVLGLAPLVRPELALVYPTFFGALLVLRWPGWWPAARWFAMSIALPAAYQIFRMGYYGLLVPNTALAKEAGESRWARGLLYAGDTVLTYQLIGPLLAVIPLALWALRTRRKLIVSLAPLIAGILMLLYVLRVGGDFMHGRMMLPVLLLVLLPAMVLPLHAVTALSCTAVTLWAVVCAVALDVPYKHAVGPDGIADERGFYVLRTQDPHPVTAEPYVRSSPNPLSTGNATGLHVPDAGPGTVPLRTDQPARLAVSGKVLGTLGASFPLDVLVVDQLGLANALGSHMELACGQRVGHEKPLPAAYVLADYMAPGTSLPDARLQAEVTRIRSELATGRFRDLLEATRAPLTPRRFWDNLVGAPARTAFRFSTGNAPCPS
ncbi:arabinofuranosyltransferase [Nonomuraea polychroma]|uniref:Arabinofuranosyltransferase n=2 Tax=Nonomuraea polychroma TaxID=46176 RepID=A0A438M2F1_9ACTN|nr:arabinofuranosyltransferase [Nonomuraea polychroma]